MQDELSKEDIKPGFREWCICEFMGHLRIIGLVTQEDLFGAKLLRLDIPAVETIPGHTEYFGGAAIYRMVPVSEAVAWELLLMGETARPVTPWELARLRDALGTTNNLRTPEAAAESSRDFEFEDEHWPQDDSENPDDPGIPSYGDDTINLVGSIWEDIARRAQAADDSAAGEAVPTL